MMYRTPPPTPFASKEDWQAYEVIRAAEEKSFDQFLNVMIVSVILILLYTVGAIIFIAVGLH